MTSVMRLLAGVMTSILIGSVTIMAPGSMSLAEDNTAVAPDKSCQWRGTAPICKGGCEPGEIADEVSANADSARNLPELFGASCFKGKNDDLTAKPPPAAIELRKNLPVTKAP